jgi:hypothetical protein
VEYTAGSASEGRLDGPRISVERGLLGGLPRLGLGASRRATVRRLVESSKDNEQPGTCTRSREATTGTMSQIRARIVPPVGIWPLSCMNLFPGPPRNNATPLAA